MATCPPVPSLRFERAPCCTCGAASETEAETKCRPTSDESGEKHCGTDFDGSGFAITATAASLDVMDAWIDSHHDCGRECIAPPACVRRWGEGEEKRREG